MATESVYCSKCGTKLYKTAEFCHKCGTQAATKVLATTSTGKTSETQTTISQTLDQRVDVGVNVLLAMVTLGIWGLVWVYQRLATYSQLSGRPLGNRINYFWLNVGLLIGTIIFSWAFFPLAFLTAIAAVVFGSLLTLEVVRDQEAILRASSQSAPLAAQPTAMVTIYVVANVLALTVLLFLPALVLAALYYYFLFRNHNLAIGSGQAA